jgi:hypothetical protein
LVLKYGLVADLNHKRMTEPATYSGDVHNLQNGGYLDETDFSVADLTPPPSVTGQKELLL